MELIKWSDSLSVNVAEIDHQHQNLVSMVNELNEAMLNGKGTDALEIILNGLINYTVTHFKTEEMYFDQFGYPETFKHKKEHNDFVAKVSEFKAEFDKGTIGLSINVMNFLSDWVENHIMGSDMKYSKFFNEKGLR